MSDDQQVMDKRDQLLDQRIRRAMQRRPFVRAYDRGYANRLMGFEKPTVQMFQPESYGEQYLMGWEDADLDIDAGRWLDPTKVRHCVNRVVQRRGLSLPWIKRRRAG